MISKEESLHLLLWQVIGQHFIRHGYHPSSIIMYSSKKDFKKEGTYDI
ncbi:MAG: hypothetical protein ACP5K2_04680 [bacterium]